ncbi:MAG: hypothetical protein WCX81_01855 [Monoglobales bacterium]
MRTKRILSLMLAVFMLASVTILAEQTANNVYVYEDFGKYNSVTAMKSVSGDKSGAGIYWVGRGSYGDFQNGRLDGTGNKISASLPELRDRNADRYFLDWNEGTTAATTFPKIGNTTFYKMYKVDADGNLIGTGSGSSVWAMFGDEWTALENTDEIYVVSVDYITYGNPNKTSNLYYNPIEILRHKNETDGSKTYGNRSFFGLTEAKVGDAFTDYLYLDPRTGGGNYSTNITFPVLENGRLQRYTAAIKANGANTGIVIDRFIDGAPWYNPSSVTATLGNPVRATHTEIGNYTIDGVAVIFRHANPGAVANVLCYTIKNEAGAFYASSHDTEIATSATSAKVKFSQPVGSATLSRESVTVEKDSIPLPSGLYEIGDTEIVYDEDTNEVYSLLEIKFPYGVSAGATYTVSFDSTVTNEVGMAIDSARDSASFDVAAAPTNVISFSAKSGLGDTAGSAITTLEVGKQANFTAKVSTAAEGSYLLIGIYDSADNLVGYTYTLANQGDEISFASKITAPGMKVKALSFGNLYDFDASAAFGSSSAIQ